VAAGTPAKLPSDPAAAGSSARPSPDQSQTATTGHQPSFLQNLHEQRKLLPSSLGDAIMQSLFPKQETEWVKGHEHAHDTDTFKDLTRLILPQWSEVFGWNQKFAVAKHAPALPSTTPVNSATPADSTSATDPSDGPASETTQPGRGRASRQSQLPDARDLAGIFPGASGARGASRPARMPEPFGQGRERFLSPRPGGGGSGGVGVASASLFEGSQGSGGFGGLGGDQDEERKRFRFPSMSEAIRGGGSAGGGGGGGSGDRADNDKLQQSIDKLATAVEKLTEMMSRQQQHGGHSEGGHTERWGPTAGATSSKPRAGQTPQGGGASAGNAMISRMLGQAVARAGAAAPGGAAVGAGAAAASSAPSATGAAVAAIL
jgi:hypothetical protein